MRHRINNYRKHRLATADVQEMLRLCNELHQSDDDDGLSLKLKLLAGMRRLTGADDAWASVYTVQNGSPSLVSVVPDAMSGRSEAGARIASEFLKAAPARRITPKFGDWCTSVIIPRPGSRVGAGAGGNAGRADHCVHSFVPLTQDNVIACLTIFREGGRDRFTPRDQSLVCTFHGQVGWIYRGDVMLVSADTRNLTRRERETLQYLLGGMGEKQIAAAMGVSHNTLHHYVKALYRHFGVSSRSELSARWMRK